MKFPLVRRRTHSRLQAAIANQDAVIREQSQIIANLKTRERLRDLEDRRRAREREP